jgi:hypothetical protein
VTIGGHKVDVGFHHVDRKGPDALDAVDAEKHPALPAERSDGLKIARHTGRELDRADGDHAGARPDGLGHRLARDAAIGGGDGPQDNATVSKVHPRIDIGRVFQLRAHRNLVAWLPGQALGNAADPCEVLRTKAISSAEAPSILAARSRVSCSPRTQSVMLAMP